MDQKKTAKSGVFSTISSQPLALSQNGGHHKIQRIKYAYLPVTQHSNCGFEVASQRIKKSAKMAQIGADFHCSATTSGDMAKRRPPLDSAHRIGLSTPWRSVPDVGEGIRGCKFQIGEIGGVLDILEEPVEIWQNGGHGWI